MATRLPSEICPRGSRECSFYPLVPNDFPCQLSTQEEGAVWLTIFGRKNRWLGWPPVFYSDAALTSSRRIGGGVPFFAWEPSESGVDSEDKFGLASSPKGRGLCCARSDATGFPGKICLERSSRLLERDRRLPE